MGKMIFTSLCVTVLNEEGTIKRLLQSITEQNKKPDEIIIVDGGSSDNTLSEINNFELQYPKLKIKVLKKKKLSIAQGRNLAIKNAKHEIIAMTDAGCVLHKSWLEEISKPFKKKGTSTVVAGFYKMTGDSNFQLALKPFIGVMPDKFDKNNFLPSARSVAFKKEVWRKIGGFSERFDRAGEDTAFNLQLSIFKFQLKRNKKALVDWEVPDNIFSASKKFYFYARGDVQDGNFRSPHNIHSLKIFGRYLVSMLYVIFCILGKLSFLPFIFLFFVYLSWAFRKSYKYYPHWQVGIWGIIIQLVSDFSVMAGFLSGIWVTLNK